MRTTATQQDIDLALSPLATQRYKLKVEIDRDGSGSGFVDVSDITGDDFVRNFTRERSLDSPAVSAKLTLAAWLRDARRWSLVPSITGSELHTGGALCKPYNRIKVSLATFPAHSTTTTYHLLFDGRIDRWSQQGPALTLECRDLIADLQDRSIKTERQYGNDDPASVTYSNMEEIIQNILDDTVNTTPSSPITSPLHLRSPKGTPWALWGPNGTLATPYPAGDATGAGIRIEQMAKRPVWEAINVYPSGIAYRLSRRWHNAAGAFVLVLEQPDRVAATPALTIDPMLGQAEIVSAAVDIQHVRNGVLIGYQVFGGRRDEYFAEDAASKTKYGDRWMSVDVGFASQVDSPTEAALMGDGILADAKEPLFDLTFRSKCLWFLELNDLVRLKADYVHTDSDNDQAVIGIEDHIAQDGPAASVVRLRGKPSVGETKISRMQRRFVFRPKNIEGFGFATALHPNPMFSSNTKR